MAYVRRRGRQLSIVAGERHPTTRKVEQRVLFTLYSRAEALEMLGRGRAADGAARFEALVEREHPGTRFDWEGLRAAVASNLDLLPSTYTRRAQRPEGALGGEVRALVRALVAADGREVEAERASLEYLRDLVALRLAAPAAKRMDARADAGPFAFRLPSRAAEVPADAREHALEAFYRGDLDRAASAFRALVAARPAYAEGATRLGLVALARGDLEGAERLCGEGERRARAGMPRRMARDALERDPRVPGCRASLRALAAVLARAGRLDDAAATATRLDEHGDAAAALTCRAALALDAGDGARALALVTAEDALAPEHRLLEAFARHERGEAREALSAFLHGALAAPFAARAALATASGTPKAEVDRADADAGMLLRALLHGYLGAEAARAPARFARVLADPRVDKTLADMTTMRAAWYSDARKGADYLARLTSTQAAAFARTLLRRAPDLVEDERR